MLETHETLDDDDDDDDVSVGKLAAKVGGRI